MNDNVLDFSTVLASSVHDMKNSLSMLLNTLDEISMTCSPQNCRSREQFTQLQYEGQRVNNHLIQLLSIYKIENALYSPNIVEHNIEEFLQESAMLHEPLLVNKNIAIDTQVDANLYGYFDREMVAGVINNVVNNAYRYSKNLIRLSAQAIDGYLVLSVEDNGRGYPAQMLCADSRDLGGVDFKTGSTGLGLYFSSLVAGIHTNKGKTGFIRCSNDGIDNGGRFSIYIP